MKRLILTLTIILGALTTVVAPAGAWWPAGTSSGSNTLPTEECKVQFTYGTTIFNYSYVNWTVKDNPSGGLGCYITWCWRYVHAWPASLVSCYTGQYTNHNTGTYSHVAPVQGPLWDLRYAIGNYSPGPGPWLNGNYGNLFWTTNYDWTRQV